MPVALDDGERLVAEHQRLLAFGRDAEDPVGDLPVGAADPDLERPQEHLALARLERWHLLDTGRIARAGIDDEREHFRPPSTRR